MPKYSLMTHQREGVKFLDSVDGIGALLYDPGVGKTGTTLAWVDEQARKPEHKGEFRVLVLAPKTAADTWVLQPPMFMDSLVKARMLQGTTAKILAEMEKGRDWRTVPAMPIGVNHRGKHLDQRVTILSMSMGALSSYCDDRTKNIRVLRAVRKYAPHLIVVDESHLIKSPTSNVSIMCYQLGQTAPHRIILTGTVNPLSILDCYGQWRFLAPWTFSDQHGEAFTKTPLTMTIKQKMSIKPWPWGRFSDRYTTRGGYKGKGIGGFQNEQEIRDRIAERSHVVLKKDALDLPPTTDIDVHVTLSPKEKRAYKQMAEELVAFLDSGEYVEAVNGLSKLMKLRQVAAGFIKDTDTGEVHTIGDSLRKTMAEVATVQLAGKNRIVVFSYFKPEVALLVDLLRKEENKAGRKDTVIETITGQTKSADRLAIRQRFGDVSGNPQRTILVAQTSTMALSVNELVTAQDAIYGSLCEQRAIHVQSRDRLDRNGQTLPVTFWNCMSPGLIGEIMRDRHKDRGNLEMALKEHVRAVAAGRI